MALLKILWNKCFAGLTWLLVYRTEKYQKLKVEIEKSSKKRTFSNFNKTYAFFIINWKNICIILVEKRKEAHGDSVDKQQKKKIERVEEKLKINNRDLSMVKMKSMFAIGFAFTALLSMFNNMWVLFVNLQLSKTWFKYFIYIDLTDVL